MFISVQGKEMTKRKKTKDAAHGDIRNACNLSLNLSRRSDKKRKNTRDMNGISKRS